MWTGPRKAAIAGAVALLLLLAGGRWAAELAVDLLWYRLLGLEEVFWTRWTAGVAVRGVAGLVVGSFVFANLWLVARTFGTLRVRRRYANIEIAERLPRAYILATVSVISLLSAWWLSGAIGSPIDALAALRAAAWGMTDPVFGRDLSFYVFGLPLLGRLQVLFAVLLVWTLLLCAATYVATGTIRWSDSDLNISPAARRHLGLLVAAMFVAFAWNLWLDRYGLLMGGRGVGGAPGYTDVAARIPGKAVVAGLALAAAGSVGYGAWHNKVRAPLIGIGALIVGALAAQVVVPSLVQRVLVEPDELARERPYIEHALEFTRYAYGLAGLGRQTLPYASDTVPPGDALARAVQGLPLWDTRPLLQSYQALETRRQYYDFASAHHDRYDGEQVVISVRELDAGGLAEPARTWQNLHIRYVRGEGVVVSPASRVSRGAEPPYYLSDICPIRLAPGAPSGLALNDPGVYFGERTRGYALVAPTAAAWAESECPPGEVPVGVPLSSWWRKLAYAWAFQSANLLLSDAVTPQSGIVYHREIYERAAAIAPFLRFPSSEGDAYPVISDGRIVWMLDAYTASSRFPFAPAASLGSRSVRYLRNSVKVTIDAVTGDVRFYAADDMDPILRTYRGIFPDLIRPLDEMPAELRRHLRVPAPLLTLQAAVLGDYHLTDPAAFYSREEAWDIPTEIYRDQPEIVTPIYAILPLPGAAEPEFLLSIPFVAAGRQNMTALLVARNDPPQYGERILYELPAGEGVPGPQQVESLIDRDPVISEQLSLWKRGGSDVIRGHLMVVPAESTLVFVEPLYLEAQASAIPQLERIILVSGNQVVMRPDVDAAIAALTGSPAAEERPDASAGGAAAASPPAALADTLLARARALMRRAEAQLRSGDWAGFGESWAALNRALQSSEPTGSTP